MYGSKALADIARAQAKAGAIDNARDSFHLASRVADASPDDWKRAWALTYIAKAQAEVGEFDAALETAEGIEDFRPERAVAIACVALGLTQKGEQEIGRETFAAAEQAAERIMGEAEQKTALHQIAVLRVKSGELGNEMKIALGIEVCLSDQAIQKAEVILTNRNECLPKIAAALAEAGDKEHFKRLLIPCAYYLDAAYEMCGLLARLYPEQASAIAEVVKE